MAPRVAIVMDETGGFEVFADDGVEVIAVSEAIPEDRLYKMTPGPIPEGMLDGPMGQQGDGSAAEARALKFRADLLGESPFGVVE